MLKGPITNNAGIEKQEGNSVSEKKELLSMLRAMWRQGDLSLRRIYPSLEELEANVDIALERKKKKGKIRGSALS
jgi:hypothetical protein